MIRREEVVKIGRFNKPHGIQGELSFSYTNDSFDDAEHPFLICEVDGILIPFRMEACRYMSGSAALVRLATIDSDAKARRLANRDVYFLKNQVQLESGEATGAWDSFIGFDLIDEKAGEIGTIRDVDDSTLNTLFIVEKDRNEYLIPASEAIITRIDEAGKKIYFQLPDGLLALNSTHFL
jgi:16S rRNA processing protein RimM